MTNSQNVDPGKKIISITRRAQSRFRDIHLKIIPSKSWIAHHGIQRNGTNFLLLACKKAGLKVINEYHPERNNPRHKHFRWYKKKEIIPGFLSRLYHNETTASSVQEINKICAYPPDTRHIVIRKKCSDGVLSLINMGVREGWFCSSSNPLDYVFAIAHDYLHYYNFWRGLKMSEPSEVQVIKYEDLLSNQNLIHDVAKTFDIDCQNAEIDLGFGEIPQSPKGRFKKFRINDLPSSTLKLCCDIEELLDGEM